MTGFVQRMLARGTGRALQPNQVAFRPRPRSRFESTGEAGQGPGLMEQATEFAAKPSRSRTGDTPRATSRTAPGSTPFFKETSGDKQWPSREPQSMATVPLPETEQADPSAPAYQKETFSAQHQQEEARTPNPIPERIVKETTVQVTREKAEPVETQDSGLRQQETSSAESTRETFHERLVEHRVSENVQTDAQAASEPAAASTDMVESGESHKNAPEEAAPAESPRLIRETVPRQMPDAGSLQERGREQALDVPQSAPVPEVTISIGRIQVEFVQPESRMNHRARPQVQRTSGFDSYAQARRGVRRR